MKKYANRFSLTKILSAGLVVVFFGIGPIKAQIEGDLYGQQTGDLAGVSSLMLAVSSNDVEGVKFFSRAGGFLINQKNVGGATALHIAARNGNIDIIIILLANGADVNIADNEGWTPLMRAAINGNAKIVEALLGKGANVALLNSNRESVLTHAALSDCFDCLNIIFTKSDLIKTMDTKLLKEQLIDSFIIARNRENKATQNLLEGYLDRVTKMTPLISNDTTAVSTPYTNNNAGSTSYNNNTSSFTSNMPQEFLAQNGAVKYILVGGDEKSVSTPIPTTTTSTIPPAPTAAATIEQTITTITPPSAAPTQSNITHRPTTEDVISNLVQSALQPNNTSIINSPNTVITKFKFVSGAPAIILPEPALPEAPQSKATHYKFNTGSAKKMPVMNRVKTSVPPTPKATSVSVPKAASSATVATKPAEVIRSAIIAPAPSAVATPAASQPPRNIAPIPVSDAEKSVTLELDPTSTK